jgi:glutamate/tyrosine decarboxylase-like PLP-dependent enzyme
LAKALELPTRFHSASGTGLGIIQSTASESTLVAALAARTRALQFYAKARPHLSPEQVHSEVHQKLVCYASEHAHSSVKKAVNLILGLPDARFRVVPSVSARQSDGSACAMKAEKLQQMVAEDVAKGLIPFFVCGTYGSTSSGAVDPLLEIGKVVVCTTVMSFLVTLLLVSVCSAAQICAAHNIYYHIDAAWAGSYWLLPRYRQALAPVWPLVDSLCFVCRAFPLSFFPAPLTIN